MWHKARVAWSRGSGATRTVLSQLSQHGMGRMGLRDSNKTQKTAVNFAWNMAMGQYLYIPFLVGWTSIYQLFWGSLGTRVLTHPHIYEVQPLQSTGKSSHSQPQNGFVLYVFLLDLKSLSEITSSGKANENHPQLIPFFPLWGSAVTTLQGSWLHCNVPGCRAGLLGATFRVGSTWSITSTSRCGGKHHAISVFQPASMPKFYLGLSKIKGLA